MDIGLTLGILGCLALTAVVWGFAGAAGHLLLAALKQALLYLLTRVGIVRHAVNVPFDARR